MMVFQKKHRGILKAHNKESKEAYLFIIPLPQKMTTGLEKTVLPMKKCYWQSQIRMRQEARASGSLNLQCTVNFGGKSLP